MGNEPAIGLEHLIPSGGGEFDMFAFGFQESTYDVNKELKATFELGDLSDSPINPKSETMPAEDTKGNLQKGVGKRTSTGRGDDLVCVDILRNQLQTCLGDEFYEVDIFRSSYSG